MNRRHNWKENLGRRQVARRKKIQKLYLQLDQIRTEILECGLDFEKYDELMAKKREILAKLTQIL